MEIREIIFIFICFALGPLMVLADGGIATDYRLRGETLVPISESTSLDVCRTKVKYYHYCRHHIIKNEDDVIFRYRFLSGDRDSVSNIQYLRSPETGEITTNIGLKYFWNRGFLIAILALIGIVAGVYELRKHVSFVKAPSPSPSQHIVESSPRSSRAASGKNLLEKGNLLL